MMHGRARSRGRIAVPASIGAAVVAVFFATWWLLTDGRSLFSGDAPQAQALRAYIDAAKRRDCESVLEALSARTREVARRPLAGRPNLELGLCDYSPAPGRLSNFETDRIRVEDVSGPVARVSASYTYERLFGFFGRGRDRHVYTLVLEDGRWRIDLTEHLDQSSRSNSDQRAMYLMHQAWVAITDHRRATGTLTSDLDVIRNELPGFEFPPMQNGVASPSSPPETLFVATGPSVACISLRSSTGTLVMIKIPATGTGTYQYGVIPTVCEDAPLPRPYHGTSSSIK